MNESAAASSVPLEKSGHALIARPQSKLLDDEELRKLMNAIEQASSADSGISVVVLDLSSVAILPSLALGLLVQISNKCKARNRKLKLAALQPQIRKVFAITRLDRVFEFADSVETSIK